MTERQAMSRLKQTVLVLVLMFAAVLMIDGAWAGQIQQGNVEGESNSDALALVDASKGDSVAEAPDLGDRVPDATAPPMPTGYNCALGASGALSFSGTTKTQGQGKC